VIAELLALTTFAAAWMGHTPESRRYADRFALALAKCGIKHEVAAMVMGLANTPAAAGAMLSRQLAGQEPLSAYRAQLLPEAFHEEMLRLEAEERGWRLLTRADIELLRGAAAVGVRRMLKMLPFDPSSQQKAG
jgi:hypothetical protein